MTRAMGLDWLGRTKTTTDVARLGARGQYGQAVEALRSSFARRLPDANERLQFAALLVLARRGAEAVPLLLSLADESLRRGRTDHALDMLQRIETIQPGRTDVASRRASLQGEMAARTEWVEPLTLDSLDDASLPEDGPVFADPDASDPSSWARAIVDAVFGPTDEERAAARSLEEAAFGSPSQPAPAAPAAATVKTRVDEVLGQVQELAGRGQSPSGRPWLASSLFAAYPRTRLLALVRDLRVCRFSAGDVILTEGEAGGSLFLIARGSVKVFVRSPHGRSFEVGRLEENDFFGEVAVISGRPRTASVVASASIELLEIRRETLESLLQGRPEAQSLLEEACVARALSPAASAVRALPKEASKSRERAHAALAAHFGDTQWSLRM